MQLLDVGQVLGAGEISLHRIHGGPDLGVLLDQFPGSDRLLGLVRDR